LGDGLVLNGCSIAQPLVGPMVVLVEQKVVHVLANFTDGSEHIRVENFGSQCPVEALDERVLRRFARLNEEKSHADISAPENHFLKMSLPAVM
jgi:hypothetical protein